MHVFYCKCVDFYLLCIIQKTVFLSFHVEILWCIQYVLWKNFLITLLATEKMCFKYVGVLLLLWLKCCVFYWYCTSGHPVGLLENFVSWDEAIYLNIFSRYPRRHSLLMCNRNIPPSIGYRVQIFYPSSSHYLSAISFIYIINYTISLNMKRS